MEIDPEKDKYIWEDLCDNRDFTVLRANHHKADQLIQDKKKQTFEDEVLWLKIRNVLFRAIASAHYSVSSVKCEDTGSDILNGNDKQHIDVLSKLILTLKEYMDIMKSSSFVTSLVSLIMSLSS